MRRFLRILVRVVGALVLLALLVAGGGYWWWRAHSRVEAIPAKLPELTDRDRLAKLRVPGSDGLADLAVADLRGHVSYLVLENKESFQAREGRSLGAALDRWRYPDDVRGYAIFDAEGMGILRFKIDEFVRGFRAEARLPIYLDYEGTIRHGFGLPKGHTGVIVLGPDGTPLLRHSGPMSDADIAALRTTLGASEPPPPAAAPAFALGPLDSARTCGAAAKRACAIVFLGHEVASRHALPFVKGGLEPGSKAATTAFEDPTLRLCALLVDQDLAAGGSLGLFVGHLGADVTLAPGWTAVPDDAAAAKVRTALGVAPGEAAVVVVDAEGRLALVERGRVALWKLGPLRELLKLKDDAT
jgi:predicted transcriptional regulator